MSLEGVFEADWTRRRLRSGPLGHLVDGFCDWLLSKGFRIGCIRTHLSNLSHLNEYLGGLSPEPITMVTAKVIEGFHRRYPSLCGNRRELKGHLRRVRSSINRFCNYLRERGIFDPQAKPAISGHLLEAYLKWMKDYQHVATTTLKNRRHDVGQFLAWLGPQATVEGLSELTAERVEEFFIAYVKRAGRGVRHSMQAALRTFFRFCIHEGSICNRLDLAVPALRTYKLSTVPRGLSDTQAQKTLTSVDRRTNAGLRDYAILQLLYTYGVRGGQVRNLRLENIRWAEDQILFKASKNGKDSLLPLTAEVGTSLLDYLQRARPRYSFPEVFLTCRAPYHPLLHSNSLSDIVRSRIQGAGMNLPSKGSHAFRHGFATRMVGEGHSLKAVADILGHRHLSTTFIYTKVDFKSLSQVALEWPEEVSP